MTPLYILKDTIMLGSGIEAFNNFINSEFVNELTNLNNSKEMFDIAIKMKLPAVNERLKGQIPNDIQDIWNQLEGIRYGIWDTKTNTPIYMDTDKEDKRLNIKRYVNNYCRILTPKEVLKYKVGTCWDQTLCICYLAYKQKLNFDVYYYECENTKRIPVSTHMVPAIPYEDSWYLIEHVYGKIYGIHKCKTVKDCWKIEDNARAKTNTIIVYRNNNFAKKLIPLFTNKNIKTKTIIDITGTVFSYEK